MESCDKKLFVGADEAGYGPNLGPLIVAVSVWEAPADLTESQLCDVFSSDFAAAPWKPGCSHVPLGDSKKLYQPGVGLSTLETGLLAMLGCVHCECTNLSDLIAHHCDFRQLPEMKCLPWYVLLDDLIIPTAQHDPVEVQRISRVALQTLNKHDVRLLAIRGVIIDEPTFNSRVQQLGSKGLLLSQTTLDLITTVLSKHSVDAEIYCDRQGGRKNYLPILLDAMPDEWFLETGVSNARSSYRNTGNRSIDIHFSVGGDRFPPTALASMFAKYLRERLMESFNTFWREQVPGIKPTAGYPVDAKRFRAAIESQAVQLGLDSTHWWRCK